VSQVADVPPEPSFHDGSGGLPFLTRRLYLPHASRRYDFALDVCAFFTYSYKILDVVSFTVHACHSSRHLYVCPRAIDALA
jgi:hypothetical protein